MISLRKGNNWGDPELLPFNIDSFNFGHPFVNATETVLVFSSDMPGGYGGLDLWLCTFDKKSKSWSGPVNLGNGVNSSLNEMYPSLHDDGSLYFSSDGFPGMGGLDIFRSAPNGINSWTNPENLKYPMNSPADDFGIIFEGKRQKGYFSSSREGGKGGDDIYSFYVTPVICLLEGFVYDEAKFKEGIKVPVPGALVKLNCNDGSSSEIRTDEKGYYRFESLVAEQNFLVATRGQDRVWKDAKENYLGFFKGKFSTLGIKKSTVFKQDLFLLLEEKKMHLPRILYDLDRFTLDHASNPKDSLEYLYRVLMENPNIVIELASHTDYRDSHQHNDTLSFNRAKVVVEYMVSRGIELERMRPKGYGEHKPLKIRSMVVLPSGRTLNEGTELSESFIKTFKEKSPDFEFLNQLNRRTEFSILRKDFKPSSNENAPEMVPTEINIPIIEDREK